MDLSFTKVKETCIYIKDIEKSRDFYHNKLGLPIIGEVKNRHIFFRVRDSVFLCFVAATTKNDERLPPHWADGRQHYAFECVKDEYESWKDRFQQQGIDIIHELTWPTGARSFYFHDPDMNVGEVVQPGLWEV